MRRIFAVILLSLCCSPLTFSLTTLPTPKGAILLNSKEGVELFNKSTRQSFWELMPYLTTERGLTYCAVASAVMVLNASNLPAPLTPNHAPYRIFDQDNFFTGKVISMVTPAQVSAKGMSLEELHNTMASFGVKVKKVYGSEVSLKQFRNDVIKAVSFSDHFIIVNVDRKYLHEEGGGQFSPIAAVDIEKDRMLVLDVARYKYPPMWVKTADLYRAMRLNKKGKVEKIRGYLLIHSAQKKAPQKVSRR
jgi:hypothetical protein